MNLDDVMQNETPFLDRFSVDITALAKEGKLGRIVAWDREIEQIIETLGNRSLKNILLIGEQGVGKIMIVEGLAQRFASGEVPKPLINKRILQIDIGSLLGGAGNRHPKIISERLQQLITELKVADAILFFDQLDPLFLMDVFTRDTQVGDILKLELQQNRIFLIGTVTPTNLEKLREAEPELVGYFQHIYVSEPSIEDAIEILRLNKSTYENFHQVTITEEAMDAAVRLSVQHIPSQPLPGKALDLIDEAASLLRRSVPEMPHTSQELSLTAKHIAALISDIWTKPANSS